MRVVLFVCECVCCDVLDVVCVCICVRDKLYCCLCCIKPFVLLCAMLLARVCVHVFVVVNVYVCW